ncbi:MAG TPA: hypothetical protein VJ203_08325 [Bacteroidales bacterium]|nr:hypothetical protein [Bacteroidales bacterium]
MMKAKVNSTRWLVLAGMLLTVGISARGESSEKVIMVMLQNKKVLIETNNPQKQQVSIKILDKATDETVYTSKPDNDAFTRKYYDLSNLPDGNYTVGVKMDNRIFEKEIQISSAGEVLLNEKIYYEPVFAFDRKSMEVTFSNPNKESVVIAFRKGNESFFTDEPGSHGAFSRKYNLKNLDRGHYLIELSSGGKYYSQPFFVW